MTSRIIGNYRLENGNWRRACPLNWDTQRQQDYRRLSSRKTRQKVAIALLAGVPSFHVSATHGFLAGGRRDWLEGR